MGGKERNKKKDRMGRSESLRGRETGNEIAHNFK